MEVAWLIIGLVIGTVLAAGGFFVGWRLRDHVALRDGEPSVAITPVRKGGITLDDGVGWVAEK